MTIRCPGGISSEWEGPMNKFTRKAVALFSAAIMSACSVGTVFPATALETGDVTVIFDCWSDDISFAAKTDPTLFETAVLNTGYVKIPEGKLEKDGYRFEGWTLDGIIAMKAGDIIDFEDGTKEVKIEPVWTKDDDKVLYSLKYILDREDAVRPEDLVDRKPSIKENQVIGIYENKIEAGDYFTKGWTDGEHNYVGDGMTPLYIIMPAHDLELKPIWKHVTSLRYITGDVDRITGMEEFVTASNEDTHTELAAANRFTRVGFNLVGWKSDLDGETYEPGKTITVPGENVTYTAVWAPRDYVVVFNGGTGKTADIIKVQTATDEVIKVPECSGTKSGYVFTGWKNNSTGDIYQPGDDYTVYGALPGMGISFAAVWAPEGSVPATTAPATAAVPTTTTVTNDGVSSAGIPTSTVQNPSAGIPTETQPTLCPTGIPVSTQPVTEGDTHGIQTETQIATTPAATGFPVQTQNGEAKFVKVKTYPTRTTYTEGEKISFDGLVIEYETAVEYTGENMGKIVYKNMPAEFRPDPSRVVVTSKIPEWEYIYDADSKLPSGDYTVKFSGDAVIDGILVKGIKFEYDIEVVHVLPPNYGDATLDGDVTLADALVILQYVANSQKYNLSEEALRNADVFDNGDGVTAMDALAIQQLDAKMIKSLPYSYLIDGKQVLNKDNQ